MLNSSSVLLPSPPVGKVTLGMMAGYMFVDQGALTFRLHLNLFSPGLSTTLTSHPLLNLGQNTTSVTFCNSPVTTRVTALTSSLLSLKLSRGSLPHRLRGKFSRGIKNQKRVILHYPLF
jgi:hypothetical protein